MFHRGHATTAHQSRQRGMNRPRHQSHPTIVGGGIGLLGGEDAVDKRFDFWLLLINQLHTYLSSQPSRFTNSRLSRLAPLRPPAPLIPPNLIRIIRSISGYPNPPPSTRNINMMDISCPDIRSDLIGGIDRATIHATYEKPYVTMQIRNPRSRFTWIQNRM